VKADRDPFSFAHEIQTKEENVQKGGQATTREKKSRNNNWKITPVPGDPERFVVKDDAGNVCEVFLHDETKKENNAEK
jgi:hypothetical protein